MTWKRARSWLVGAWTHVHAYAAGGSGWGTTPVWDPICFSTAARTGLYGAPHWNPYAVRSLAAASVATVWLRLCGPTAYPMPHASRPTHLIAWPPPRPHVPDPRLPPPAAFLRPPPTCPPPPRPPAHPLPAHLRRRHEGVVLRGHAQRSHLGGVALRREMGRGGGQRMRNEAQVKVLFGAVPPDADGVLACDYRASWRCERPGGWPKGLQPCCCVYCVISPGCWPLAAALPPAPAPAVVPARSKATAAGQLPQPHRPHSPAVSGAACRGTAPARAVAGMRLGAVHVSTRSSFRCGDSVAGPDLGRSCRAGTPTPLSAPNPPDATPCPLCLPSVPFPAMS